MRKIFGVLSCLPASAVVLAAGCGGAPTEPGTPPHTSPLDTTGQHGQTGPAQPEVKIVSAPGAAFLSSSLRLTLSQRNALSCAVRASPSVSVGAAGARGFVFEAVNLVSQITEVAGQAANTMPQDSARVFLVAECSGLPGTKNALDSVRVALETPALCQDLTLSPSVWSLSKNGPNGGFISIRCSGNPTFTVGNGSWYFGTQAGMFLQERMPATVWVNSQEVMTGLSMANPKVGTVLPICVQNPLSSGNSVWCGSILIGA